MLARWQMQTVAFLKLSVKRLERGSMKYTESCRVDATLSFGFINHQAYHCEQVVVYVIKQLFHSELCPLLPLPQLIRACHLVLQLVVMTQQISAALRCQEK
jgi:hypothetical protein